MNHQVIGLLLDTTGAFLMMALALWVWRVRPEARMNRAFAQLVSLLALAVLLYNIGWLQFYSTGTGTPSEGLWGAIGSLIFILAAPFIIKLERALPDSLEQANGRLPSWIPLGIALIYLVLSAESILRLARGAGAGPTAISTLSVLTTGTAISIVTSVVLYLIARLAIRYERSGRDEPHLRWQAAAVALSLGAFPLFSSSTAAIEVPILGARSSPFDGLVLIPMTLAGLTWIVAGMGRDGRLAIVTGLSLLALVLAGVTAAAIFGSIAAINSGAIGVLRVSGTGLLAYTILRHQLFDIELQLKWTLSRGTIAGIFIATFFVVSELVAGILSEQIGIFFGVLTTGFLVFAISPLQRFADRVSDAAMPHVQDTPTYREERRREIYTAAILSALNDGVVTDRERSVLATLADQLGISSVEALELERQATGPSMRRRPTPDPAA